MNIVSQESPSIDETVVESSFFAKLPKSLQEKLQSQGILKPTSVQEEAFSPILEGRDVIAQSRTGSGKTLAFGLPAFIKMEKAGQKNPRLLVLTPTRELAEQVSAVFDETFAHLGFRVLAITGGKSYRFQISRLQRGVDAVVATPGRLNDLVEQKEISLSDIQILVLDEMDEMLDFGFAEDILKIKQSIGQKVQTALFSATFPPKVTQMARQMVKAPFEIRVPNTDTSNGQIEHQYIEIKSERNLDALLALLLYYMPEHAIVFCKTRDETRYIYNSLIDRGFLAGVLNGEMTQQERSQTMDRFKNKQLKILVATDVAARGIDVSNLSHVINFNVPTNIEAYTHRTGRTGRAGASGKAWTIVTYRERREYQFICEKVKINPTRLEIPNASQIAAQFIKNHVFQMREKLVDIPQFVRHPIEQFIKAMSPQEVIDCLSDCLMNEATRQLGRTLSVENLLPASKTEFGQKQEAHLAVREKKFGRSSYQERNGGRFNSGGNYGGGNYNNGRSNDKRRSGNYGAASPSQAYHDRGRPQQSSKKSLPIA